MYNVVYSTLYYCFI